MALADALSKKMYVACPNCGTFNIATRILGRWSLPPCASCGSKIDIKDITHSTVTCEKCGNVVLFNGLSSAAQICPSCHSQLNSPVNRPSFRLIPCPRCGTEVNVNGQQGTARCPVCQNVFDIASEVEKRKQQESGRPVLIQYGANTRDILWKHPQNSFPKGSRLIVKEGSAAILLENGSLHMVAGPGSYLLEDQELSLSQKLMNPDGSWNYLTDIIFVQKKIAAQFKWGTAYPSEIRDAFGTYTVTANGSLQLKVTDPLTLAEHLNFSSLAVPGAGAQVASGLIGDLVVQQIGLCFGAPLQELCDRNHWTLQNLVKTDLQRSIPQLMNNQLYTFGLELEPGTFFIYSLNCTETPKSVKERALLDSVQKPILWSAGSLRIHMKDDPAKYADFTLEGSVRPTVRDNALFLNSSLGRNMISSPNSARDFGSELNHLLHDLFTQILQPMVNSMDADIRELGPYYPGLKSTACDFLNLSMKPFGLVFDNLSFEQKNFIPSAALSNSLKNEEMRSFILDEERMRRFTQSIKLVEKQETGEFDLQSLNIEVEIGEQMSPYLDRQAELDSLKLQREERKTSEKLASDTRISVQQYDNDLVILRKQFEKELAAEDHKVNMRDMLHKIDQSDLNWQEKLDEYARIRDNLDFLNDMDHDVKRAQAQYEAKHTMLNYTAEEMELLQANADRTAQRKEEIKQADFERDMQMRREKWEQGTRLCQLEYELAKYKAKLDYLSKADLSHVSFKAAEAAAEREFAERLRAQKDRDDASFFSRSNQLMNQIRAFKTEMDGFSPAMKETASHVFSGNVINSLLASLQSVVGSVSNVRVAETLDGKIQADNKIRPGRQ